MQIYANMQSAFSSHKSVPMPPWSDPMFTQSCIFYIQCIDARLIYLKDPPAHMMVYLLCRWQVLLWSCKG